MDREQAVEAVQSTFLAEGYQGETLGQAELERMAERVVDALGLRRSDEAFGGPEFDDLGYETGLFRFQGGAVILKPYGCRHCGNAFWVEANRPSEELAPGLHHCPRCGKQSVVKP